MNTVGQPRFDDNKAAADESLRALAESGVLPVSTAAAVSAAPGTGVGSEGHAPDSVLSFSFASRHGVMLDGCELLHRPGLTLAVILELQRLLYPRVPTLTPLSDEAFNQRLTKHYQTGEGAAQTAADDLGAEYDFAELMDVLPCEADLLASDDDAPVIRLINAILSQAVRSKASDIHIEPFEDRVAIRFRIDGILTEVLSPKPMLAPILASRLKVMARLDIAEKRLPQDGRMTVKLAGHGVDIRVSTLRSAHGERVVMRLLDQAQGYLQLEQLAMPAQVESRFRASVAKPHGIILVTGPTGSGKSTTLYAGLSSIDVRQRNILTIEDPIEYLLAGIGQTQVNTKVDMTFARGLRAILRQDPDVVMVGEIRDSETASIAVQASLTGHLVLSTLHTNTAIGAITRLKDMGIEPFLLASSLEAVMAQRLVRLLCEHCKQQYTPLESEARLLGITPGTLLYRAGGCEHCNHSGYRGRAGIYEWITIDDEMRQLIHEQAPEQALLEHARKHSEPIAQAGRQRIVAGQTSTEEVLRVTSLG